MMCCVAWMTQKLLTLSSIENATKWFILKQKFIFLLVKLILICVLWYNVLTWEVSLMYFAHAQWLKISPCVVIQSFFFYCGPLPYKCKKKMNSWSALHCPMWNKWMKDRCFCLFVCLFLNMTICLLDQLWGWKWPPCCHRFSTCAGVVDCCHSDCMAPETWVC